MKTILNAFKMLSLLIILSFSNNAHAYLQNLMNASDTVKVELNSMYGNAPSAQEKEQYASATLPGLFTHWLTLSFSERAMGITYAVTAGDDCQWSESGLVISCRVDVYVSALSFDERINAFVMSSRVNYEFSYTLERSDEEAPLSIKDNKVTLNIHFLK